MHRFKELSVWQKAMELSTCVYKMTDAFPKKEQFGLISQINRCAVSVPSNIAEGAGRNSDKEFANFLSIAMGSSYELETQLIISYNLNYIKKEELEVASKMIHDIQNMIYGLQQKLLRN